MTVYLIGFMGSGKSYLGRLLSNHLGVDHIDLDEWIESKYGKSITEIFQSEGEDRFREKEHEALKSLYEAYSRSVNLSIPSTELNLIISCGGGTPCFNGNMEWMNQHGLTIWLDPPTHVLLERLAKEKAHRPLLAKLSDDQMKHFVEQKLKERSFFYNQARLVLHDEVWDLPGLLKQINDASHLQ
jgi:shikimate kinase